MVDSQRCIAHVYAHLDQSDTEHNPNRYTLYVTSTPRGAEIPGKNTPPNPTRQCGGNSAKMQASMQTLRRSGLPVQRPRPRQRLAICSSLQQAGGKEMYSGNNVSPPAQGVPDVWDAPTADHPACSTGCPRTPVLPAQRAQPASLSATAYPVWGHWDGAGCLDRIITNPSFLDPMHAKPGRPQHHARTRPKAGGTAHAQCPEAAGSLAGAASARSDHTASQCGKRPHRQALPASG